ncbi:MAG: helix-turn-helix transcriptional regulator [Nitrospira sp.]|nr:helix-turn-helix transcriptional regulator [Nitrospira sp.]
MRRDREQLSNLVHRIYEASAHPEQWHQVVASITSSFGAPKGLMLTPNVAPQHGGLVFPAGIDEAALQVWATRYIDKNVWAIGMEKRGLWREGQAWVSEDMLPRKEFLASPFYREFLSTQGIAFVCAGIVFAGSSDLPATTLAVFRDLHEPNFDRDDIAWMKLLVSHVSRSLGLMMRLDRALVQNASLLASFDRLSLGVVLLNEQMKVVHLNQAAEKVIDRGDGLFISAEHELESVPDPAWRHKSVSCISKGHARKSHNGKLSTLSRWLRDQRDAPMTDPQHFLQGYTVSRLGDDHNKQYYVLQCAPVPVSNGGPRAWQIDGQGGTQIRFAVFITDPQAVQLPSRERLGELYGLTPAEANVACEFARGHSYKQVARRLKISEDTVRAHIKQIYPKTRVNRQSDLVRLILSMSTSGV